MTIEGYFTSDEVSSAADVGAAILPLPFGRTSITFDDRRLYDQWSERQLKEHPERWSHCIRLPAKKPAPIVH